jgi:hypothetical protein
MTGADLIDRARRARKAVGAVALLFAPIFVGMVLIKRRARWR